MAKTDRTDLASAGGGGGRPAKKKEGGKLIFAIVLLVVAGAVVGWTQGWFGGSKDPGSGMTAEETAAQNQEFEKAKQATEQKVKTGQTSPPAGS